MKNLFINDLILSTQHLNTIMSCKLHLISWILW